MAPVRRREFLRLSTGVAGGALLDGWRLVHEIERLAAPGPLSPQERSALTEMIGRNIEAGWQLFRKADTEQMLSVGRAQLHMLRRHNEDLDPDAVPTLYSAASRLLGATYHRRGHYHEALEAHDTAYLAASEVGDVWSMAQCRAWQAYGRQALGDHAVSLQTAKAALRLISDRSDIDSVRLRGRLLTSAAMNAATLKDTNQVGAMLEASEALLDQLEAPSEEFDRAVWLDSTGVCALRLGQPEQAASRFQEALEQTPDHWIPRRVFTTIGLATALTVRGDADEALAISDGLVPQLRAMQSRELTDHFVGFLRDGLLAKYPGDPHGLALLAHIAASPQQQ
jgi:tetratricopeptide (TPR) repeat protein